MKTLSTLLVCLDLTEMDDILIPYLANLGKALPDLRKVVFIHNIRFDDPEEATGITSGMEVPLRQVVEELLEDKVQEGFKPFCPEVETDIRVTEKNATPAALSEAALHHKANAVILGKKVTYPGSGLVVEMLFRIPDFHAPILLVPETAYHKTTNLLVAVDFSKGSKKALDYGRYLRDALPATLSCQHVYDIPIHYFPYLSMEGLKEKMERNARENWEKYQAQWSDLKEETLDCAFTFSNKNNVAQAIYHHALRSGKDLIIVNSKGKGEITAYLIGSVALRLVKMDMHIPLLVTNQRS